MPPLERLPQPNLDTSYSTATDEKYDLDDELCQLITDYYSAGGSVNFTFDTLVELGRKLPGGDLQIKRVLHALLGTCSHCRIELEQKIVTQCIFCDISADLLESYILLGTMNSEQNREILSSGMENYDYESEQVKERKVAVLDRIETSHDLGPFDSRPYSLSNSGLITRPVAERMVRSVNAAFSENPVPQNSTRSKLVNFNLSSGLSNRPLNDSVTIPKEEVSLMIFKICFQSHLYRNFFNFKLF